LKLDERGFFSDGDCSNHKSGSGSLSCCSDLPCSSSPSNDSLTDYLPQASPPSPLSSTQNSILIPASSCPTLTPSTSGKPTAHPEAPKHKIRSMAQLVASMLFHRQTDALRRYPARKTGSESASSHSYDCNHPSPVGGSAGVLPTPRSRLSKVILPEELEADMDWEEGQGAETGDEVKEEDINVDERPLSGMDTDLDEPERALSCENSSHIVTRSAPSYTHTSTQCY